jgi:hypothetical protein
MPNTVVRVREVRGSIMGKDLKSALSAALSQPWPGGKPPVQANAQAQQGGENQNGDNNRGDRGRRDRDNDNGDNNND